MLSVSESSYVNNRFICEKLIICVTTWRGTDLNALCGKEANTF